MFITTFEVASHGPSHFKTSDYEFPKLTAQRSSIVSGMGWRSEVLHGELEITETLQTYLGRL